MPGVWGESGGQNPVRYERFDGSGEENANEVRTFLETQSWKPFPSTAKEQVQEVADVKPLTMEEAKAGLAAALGVSADRIELTLTLKY